ncbi:MAG: hypothetical protein M0037_10425, partial [Betaproteobacteria bacterium]|nr:hypothetical protein [Betaproteobacteria bacterium]
TGCAAEYTYNGKQYQSSNAAIQAARTDIRGKIIGNYILDYLATLAGPIVSRFPRPDRNHFAALSAAVSKWRGLSAHSHTISTRQPNLSKAST